MGSSETRRMTDIPATMAPHVSVENQFPEDLFDAMAAFIASHPEWDQYRLIQSAVAGFLFQQGCKEQAVVQHYLNSLFRRRGLGVA
jgi:Protein of unknown function (DUF2811)